MNQNGKKEIATDTRLRIIQNVKGSEPSSESIYLYPLEDRILVQYKHEGRTYNLHYDYEGQRIRLNY